MVFSGVASEGAGPSFLEKDIMEGESPVMCFAVLHVSVHLHRVVLFGIGVQIV